MSFWQWRRPLKPPSVRLSAGLAQQGVLRHPHSGPHSLPKEKGRKEAGRPVLATVLSKPQELKQPLLPLTQSLGSLDWVQRNPEAEIDHSDFFGDRSEDVQCQLLKASFLGFPVLAY